MASLSDSIPLEQKLVQIFLRFKSKAFLNGCKCFKSNMQVACLNPNSTYCNNVMETERILAESLAHVYHPSTREFLPRCLETRPLGFVLAC